MVDFFTLLKLQGYPVKKALSNWKELQEIKNLGEWQKQQAWQMVQYHQANNRGYADFLKGRAGKWEEIPVLDKDAMRCFGINDPSNLVKGQKYYFASTSGSTGKPFRFAKDYLSHTLTWVAIAHSYGKVGVSLNDLQARFYGISSAFTAHRIERLKDLLGNRWRFPLLNLSDESLEEWIRLFSRRPYAYLYGYSYPIITFAQYLEKTGRTLKKRVPSLKACILTAEMCEPNERQLVEKALGVPVCNEYGTSEFGIVGFAREDYWELPNALLLVEILDDSGNVLPYGELGNITVTSLFCKGTPFIRYQTGDLGVMKEVNGHRVITQLFGRREAMAVLPSGKKTPGDTAFYYVFRDFTSRYTVLTEYKVVQKAVNQFEIKYTAPRDLDKNETDYLLDLCEQALEKGLEFHFIRHEELDRTRMGKFKRFESEVK